MALQILRILLNYNLYNKYSNNIEYIFKDNKELNLLYLYLNNIHDKYKRDITIEEYKINK